MNFNSIEYLIFLPIVFVLHFWLEHKYRWILLLIASCIFYMSWNWHYMGILLVSTLTDYFCAIEISKTEDEVIKKRYLLISLVINLGLLFVFKYFNFFMDSIEYTLQSLKFNHELPYSRLLLPVGISFYTFQALSYTIDVYRGVKKAETNLGIFLLYITFFPQLVAGPIERSTRLMRQFYIKQKLRYENISQGMRQMLWGFLKKVVIADYLAIYVNQVYNHPADYNGGSLLLASVFFSFQIYCDFSGYSDIAIGTARLFGIDLMKNFNAPYLARSVREFWKRWHISLSTWFKDYLYIPLGGNKVSNSLWYRNILIVFLVSGIWHGANWTFVLWGLAHGILLVLEAMTVQLRHGFYQITHLNKSGFILKTIKTITCFSFISFTWVLFRANNFNDLCLIFNKIVGSFGVNKTASSLISNVESFDIGFALSTIAILFTIELLHSKFNLAQFFGKLNIGLRWSVYAASVVLILLCCKSGNQEFIYFQF